MSEPGAWPSAPEPAIAQPISERVTVVLLTYNCAHRLEPVLEHLRGLPVIAVDNASRDGTADVLRGAGFDVIVLPRNIGAAARNVGVEHARTPYVAFCDDDCWPERQSLELSADLFDAHPRLGLVAARVLVGDRALVDPSTAEMAGSPLRADDGIPGVPVLGFMAGAVVVRTAAYRDAGGYAPEFFISGEEESLAIEMARRGWELRYLPYLTVRQVARVTNARRVYSQNMRNKLWNAWLYRRMPNAARRTLRVLAFTRKDANWVRGLMQAVRGLPWVWRHRTPVDRRLDAQLRAVDRRPA